MKTTSNRAIHQEHLKERQLLRQHAELLSLYSQDQGRFGGSVSSHYNLKSNICQVEQFIMGHIRNWYAACSSDIQSGKENYEESAVAYK